MTKSALRKTYLEKRQKLDSLESRHLTDLLTRNFFENVDLSSVNLLHTFLPVARNNEPDTWQIIDRLRRDYAHIQIAVPRISEGGQSLDTVIMDPGTSLIPNRWNIPEPIGGRAIDPAEIDIVLVPLLAFDQKGNRVGYGKGFYDKFLPQCRPECRRIGVSFFGPVDEITDTDAYDQRLTAAITPDHWFVFP